MTSNRSKHDIIASIIETCLEPANQNKVIRIANLTYPMFYEYRIDLIKAGLLMNVDGKYLSTELGRNFLTHYRELERLLQ